MKKLLLALALCAFVSGPVFADTHEEGGAAAEETTDMGQMDHAEAPAVHAHGKMKGHAKADMKKKKKMKKTAQKTTTETSEEGGMDQAPEAN